MKKIVLIVVFLFFCSLPVYSADYPEKNREVITEGEAGIENSAESAFNNAVSQALRIAVEQVAGVMISSETKVQNFQVLNDEIYTRAVGFVSGYELISRKDGVDSVKVKIKAMVGVEPVAEQLKKLGLLRRWTVAVIVADSSRKLNQAELETVKTTIDEKIINAGFRAVDQEILTSLEKPEIFEKILAGNYLAASPTLKNNGVDLLLVAKADSQIISENTIPAYEGLNVTLKSVKSRIESRLIRVDTGELVSVKSVEEKAVGPNNLPISKSLEKSSTETGSYFVKEILQLQTVTSTNVQLKIKGLSYNRAKEFSENLKQIHGIKRVFNRGFQNQEALYEIECEGDVHLLADNLSENKLLQNKFKFEINSVSNGKIEAFCK